MQRSHAISDIQPRPQTGSVWAALDRLNRSSLLLRIVSDGLALILAFWFAHLARYRFEVGGAVRQVDWQPFSEFAPRAALFVALSLLALVVRGGYSLPREASLIDEAYAVIGGVTIAMSVVIMTAFLGQFAFSRLVFLMAWVLAIVLLMVRRILSREVRDQLWQRSIGVERVLVVGAGQVGRRLLQTLTGSPHGYQVVGFLDDGAEDRLSYGTEAGIKEVVRLGDTADLTSTVEHYDIDEVFIALPAAEQERILGAIDQCRSHSVSFKIVPDLLQLSMDRAEVADVAGIPLIGLKDASITGGRYLLKRSIDLVSAVLLLLVFAIPMAFIAIAIKLQGDGPAIYRQLRIGKEGEPFTLYKFRCMVNNADQLRQPVMAANANPDRRLFKLADDPRLTPIGRELRRWSLDELPQLFNVLDGSMSFVGPRPQLLEETEQYEEWHRQRLLVAPGMTGLWQINGRSDLNFDDMVKLDLYYAEHWSPWLDLKIILRTIPAVLSGRGAY